MAHQYTMEERLEQLAERRANVECGGGEAKLEKQHTQGKLTARVSSRSTTRAGDQIKIAFDMTRLHIFDKDTERCIVH